MAQKAVAKHLQISKRILNNPHSATHFACLPLYNEETRAKLEGVAQFLRDEPTLSKVKRRDFRLPKSYFIHLFDTRLETSASIEAAIETVQNTDIDTLLTDHPSELHPQPDAIPRRNSQINGNDILDHGNRNFRISVPEPFKVTIRGYKFPSNKCIVPDVIDPSNRLIHFLRTFRQRLLSAGIAEFAKPGRAFNDNFILGPQLVGARSRKSRTPLTSVNPDGRRNTRSITDSIDNAAFLGRFKDHTWAEDIPIEKISLCKEGRKPTFRNGTLIDEEYEEIASIPLPQ